MIQLVQLPIKKPLPSEFHKIGSKSSTSHRAVSSHQEFKEHQLEHKSWEFLSQYVNNAQHRHERMKAKIAEAASLAKKLEVVAALEKEAKLKNEELDKLKIENQKKAAKEAEEKKNGENNMYERPQAKALADSFLDATKEIFSMSADFQNSQDPALKSFRLKLKMTINRRTGQITDSLKQIKAVVVELIQLCFESRTISKSAYSYCLVLLSNKLLAQAESQVSLHAPSAFPLALVAVEISTNIVEFPSVLMSALIKKCCFSVPMYPKNLTNSEAYKIELGYFTIDGVVKESDTAFFERMSGLISFYAAIIQTNSLSGKPNVLGLNLGWTWLATILNLPPRPITPYLLVSFLEQSSFALYKKYGTNFEKLIKFTSEKYISVVPNSSVAAKTRLELLCKEMKNGTRIKEPVGMKIAP